MRAAIFAFALLLSLATHGVAVADEPRTEAQALFDEGRAASVRGDCKTALGLFRRSQELAPGRGTLVNIALCEETVGELTQALEHFTDVLPKLAVDDDRGPMVKQHMAAVEGRLAHLRILTPALATTTLTVRLDDRLVDAARIGADLPVNPGRHVLVASAPGRGEKQFELTLREGERRSQTITLDDEVAVVDVAPSSSARRTAGFVFAGIGAASLVGGAVTGILSLSDHSGLATDCPSHVGCSSDVVSRASAGKSLAIVSTIAFATGAAAGGVGVYLILSGKPQAPTRAAFVALSPAGATLATAF